MKVPLKWLGEMVLLPKDTRSLTDGLTMVGHMLDKIEFKDGDTILDLELRGNRADCYSIIGIAREVAAISGKSLNKYPLLTLKRGNLGTKLAVRTPLVKRVGMAEIKNVKITESPKWLKDRLEAYGIASVNNIVDLTNYVMVETGEPMHAFDHDKVGTNLEIRLAKNGEKIMTFQGTTLTLMKEDLVWAKGDTVLSVAGAIGEKTNSISDNTKNVLLEAANYDRANIRRSVYRHNLLTDAGIRHEKELDPNLVDIALARFLFLLKENNWGEFKPVYSDYYPDKSLPWTISLSLDFLLKLGGIKFTLPQVVKILKSLGFEIADTGKNSLTAKVPTWRTDVKLEEDLIEEILRIHGYDKISVQALALPIPSNVTPDYIIQEENLKSTATCVGMDEVVTLPFVKESLTALNKSPQSVLAAAVSVKNPPSPDLKDLRLTMLPNLYELARKAHYEREPKIVLFEIGKVYYKTKGKYEEKRRMGIIYYDAENCAFSDFKGILNGFFEKSGIDLPDYKLEPNNLNLTNPYHILVASEMAGFGGIYENYFYAEIYLDSLLDKDKKYKVSLWPKYPPQIEDITFELPEKTYIGDVINAIKSTNELINKVLLNVVYENYYTFKTWYQSGDHTLSNTEVEEIRKTIVDNIVRKFRAKYK